VHEGVGLRADVEEGAVGRDGLDLRQDLGADHEVAQLDPGLPLAVLVLADAGPAGGALDVVGLDVGRDAVHGRDLDGNLGLLDGGHGEGEKEPPEAGGAVGARAPLRVLHAKNKRSPRSEDEELGGQLFR